MLPAKRPASSVVPAVPLPIQRGRSELAPPNASAPTTLPLASKLATNVSIAPLPCSVFRSAPVKIVRDPKVKPVAKAAPKVIGRDQQNDRKAIGREKPGPRVIGPVLKGNAAKGALRETGHVPKDGRMVIVPGRMAALA